MGCFFQKNMIQEYSRIGYHPHIHLRCRVETENSTVECALRSQLHISYEMLKKAKYHGHILRNGAAVFSNATCSQGDLLEVLIDEDKSYPCRPLALPLDVVYEDAHILVVNKPAPLPTVLGLNDTCNTLPNALMHYFREPEHFIYRPLNRLDSGTSGLMLIAKNAYIQSCLQKMLHTEDFQREYAALVEHFCMAEEGTIDLPIARLSVNTWGIHERGKPAQTNYRLLRRNRKFAMLCVQLHTGRTHQIRLHFAHHGSPVVGDYVYGQEHPLLPGRFGLHSHQIRVKLPYKEEVSIFTAALPPVFEQIYADGAGDPGSY